SDAAVDFTIARSGADDRVVTVAAGATASVEVEVSGAGAAMTVSAGDWSTALVVPPFDCEPPPPPHCSEWVQWHSYSEGAVVIDGDSFYRAKIDIARPVNFANPRYDLF